MWGPMKINVDGKTVGATIVGGGPTIILLHSLLADCGSFARLIPSLSEIAQVIALDLPGFGESDFVDGDLIAVSDHLAKAIAQFSEEQSPIILGNGFGGFLALQIAIRHPNLARRLIIADAGATFSESARQAFRNLADAAGARGLEAVVEPAMRRLFSVEFQETNPALIQERQEAFLKINLQTFQNACVSLSALDMREEVRGLSIPVLILVGEQDEATPPAMAKELNALVPSSRFVMLPGCAHVPQLQMPDLFLDSIRDFITAPPD